MAQDTEITILARNGTGADIWKLLTEHFEVVIARRTHSEDGETAILSLAITGKKRREDTAMTEITYNNKTGNYIYVGTLNINDNEKVESAKPHFIYVIDSVLGDDGYCDDVFEKLANISQN